MAHGAGGKATQALIEGLFLPALRKRGSAASCPTPARWSVDGAPLALTTDSFVVKPLRFPGGSIGELAVNGTVNDLAVSGARPLALSLSLILEEGLRAEQLRREVDAIAGGRARGRRARSSPATRRSSSAATPTACTSARPGSARVDRAANLRPAAIRPGDRILLSGPIGEHGMAIMLARGEFELEAAIESDTRVAVAGGRRAARAPPVAGCAACATQRAAGWPRCSTSWRAPRRWRCSWARAPFPVEPAVAGARDARDRPHVRGQRGQLVAFVAPRPPTRPWPRCAPPGRERAADIGEVSDEPPGDGARADGLWRPAGDGPLVGDPLPRIC